MATDPKKLFSLEEYFSLELESEEKYEYWNGQIFCMSGASRRHVFITGNVYASLRNSLAGRDCIALSSDMRIKAPAAPPYKYADVSAACGKLEFEEIGGLDVLVNPVLIVEVLSPSTERVDRGPKFVVYQSIPSFREYLLISQTEPRVAQYVKQDDGVWKPREVSGLDASFHLPSIDCILTLKDVYQSVEF